MQTLEVIGVAHLLVRSVYPGTDESTRSGETAQPVRDDKGMRLVHSLSLTSASLGTGAGGSYTPACRGRLKDRVEAAGGRISLHSPPGQGTTLAAPNCSSNPRYLRCEDALGSTGRPEYAPSANRVAMAATAT